MIAMESCLDLLMCTLCDTDLVPEGSSLRCRNGHTFDIARSGYVNLYIAGHKRRKYLGDSKAMLRARRRVLERGVYGPLAAAVEQRVVAHVSQSTQRPAALLDVGSGEGYYTGRAAAAVRAAFPTRPFCFFGLDLAKEGVQMAAKRYREIRFLVADVKQKIPLADQTVDVLLNIFAPRAEAAFARVSVPGALLLVVIPAANHLQGLRERFNLLDVEEDKRRHVLRQFAPWFELEDVHALSFSVALTNQQLRDLVEMTPSARHLAAEQREALLAVPALTANASFELLSFRRRKDGVPTASSAA